jgi:hypothetical protein
LPAAVARPAQKKSSDPRKSSSPVAAAANLVVVRHEEPAGELSLTGSIGPGASDRVRHATFNDNVPPSLNDG